MTTLVVHHRPNARRIAAALVASVWLYHGVVNKLLGASPRHLLIVQTVPGLAGRTGEVVLALVAVAEIAIAAWVLSGVRPRTCAAVQTIALLAMNVTELTFARDHLLWPAMLLPANLVFLAVAWFAAAGFPAHRLRRHPFPVVAHFDDSLVLTYALPARVLEPLLPPGLSLDTYDGFGFVAVAMVRTRGLRPAFVPRIFGKDFTLTGYRIFTKFKTPTGRTLRGLRILRSDADRACMVRGGNLLTHYNYRKCDATISSSPDRLALSIRTPDGSADVDVSADLSRTDQLPTDSPFRTLHDARRFAGPLPWTFDHEPETNSIVAIKGVRENWSPRLVHADVRRLSFFDHDVRFRGVTPILASAFHVRDIDYRWERGIRHPLTPETSTFQGVRQIARFNWPQYVAGSLAIVATLAVLATVAMPRWLVVLGVTGVAASAWWLLASLVASHLIYDRSPLRRWRWVADAIGSSTPRTWVNLHAGLDESSPALRALFPDATGRVLDFFDAAAMTEPSILRARTLSRNTIRAERVDLRRLPLADGSIDLATLLLSAHELRTRDARVALLAELRRSLSPDGRIVVAEHLRDVWNFAAFGPGFTHFFSRCEWLATFATAGLTVEKRFRITPFIAVFVLRKR